MFVIITNSRRNHELLVMVDRKRQKRSFWSNRLDDAFIYFSQIAAQEKAKSLKFNNPRVMTFKQAQDCMSYTTDFDQEYPDFDQKVW